MAGKYKPLRGKLPAFQEDSSYEQKKDIAKQVILGTLDGAGTNVERLAAISSEREAKYKQLENCGWRENRPCGECVYCLKVEVRAISKLLLDVLIDDGVDNLTLEKGGTINIEDKPHPNVTKEKEPKLIKWMIENCPEMVIFSLKGLDKKQLMLVMEWAEKKTFEFSLDFNSKSFFAMVGDNLIADMRAGKPVTLPPGVEYFMDTQAKVKLAKNGGE